MFEDVSSIGPEASVEAQGTIENKVWYLQQSPLFANVGHDAVEGTQGIFTMKIYRKKTQVFDVGDNECMVYVIKRGKVRLVRQTASGKELTVVVLGAGDIFGEEAIFGKKIRTTTAVVLDEALLCSAHASDILALVNQDPTIALNVAQVLSTRIDQVADTLEDIAYAKLPERLLHLFERLARDHGIPVERGILIDVHLTNTEIASLIGSTRESVSVELNALVKAGTVLVENGRYILPSV